MNGSQIVNEQWDDKLVVYLYDESGSPIGMQYRTNSMAEGTFYTYLFEKNLQGDIIAVYNTSGTKLVSYVYDAWGNVTVTNHNVSGTNSGARHNPFRYRGYYYDTETGYYYLQSRYYNPKWGRFLNADGYVSTGQDILGYNMYIYCGNNPINRIDISGTSWRDVVNLFGDVGNTIGNFFTNTFGGAVYISNSYDAIEMNTIYVGYETGMSTSRVIAGDNSKPITFYAQKSSKWWKFWEYKVGVNVNIGEGGFNIGIGYGERTISVCSNNTSIEFVEGINKIGFTISEDVDFKNRTAGPYAHLYVRPWTVGVTLVALYYTGGVFAPVALAPIFN